MDRFTRQTRRFFTYGIDLNNPTDAIRDGFYPILENIRSYQSGVIQPRPGLQLIGGGPASQTPLHTVRRLNDPLNATWTRIVGTGTTLAYGQTSFAQAAYNSSNIVLSGDPVTLVPYRPDQSPESWMYVADSLALYKIKRDGTVHKTGVTPPTVAPSTNLGAELYSSYLDLQNTTGWTIDGVVFTTAVSTGNRVNIATTNTTRAIYDSGGIGWCSLVLPTTAMSVLGVGSLLTVFTPGPVITILMIHEVYRQSASVKVGNIIYDTTPSNTGLCCIQPNQPVKEIQYNSIVLLNGSTYARVLSVVVADDGSTSFRCDTGASTISSTQSLQVVGSVRVYDPGASMTPAGGDAIGQDYITTAGGATPGTGWINSNTAIDLSKLSVTGSGYLGGALQDDDNFHLSLNISDLSKVTQGRILFNCDSEATPTYTKNYYYYDFRPSDMVPSVKGTQTALDNRNTIISNRQTDDGLGEAPRGSEPRRSGPRNKDPESGSVNLPSVEIPDPTDVNTNDPSPGGQIGTGDSQWLELIFRRGDLAANRVGSDTSRGFANINGFRLELSVTASVTLKVNSLSVWGTYPLDIGDLGSPYHYRYRYRVSSTGAMSNWSPPSLGGLVAKRDKAAIICTASSAPEVDKIDVQRWGGTATEWLFIGSCANSSPTFSDSITDEAARNNAEISDDDVHYIPWLVVDIPKSGTTASSGVSGTTVKDSSTTFSTSWAKGTGIKVGGIDTTIRRVISTSLLETNDSLGSQSSVSWEIQEPLLVGQPLPSWWGPWRGRAFACGDIKNPGTVYISNGNDFDSTNEGLTLEITAPSEPLVNGCTFNGQNYVFSTERMFEIREVGPDQFEAVEVPNGKGLWSRWALAVGTRIFFLAKDGIYETYGGEPKSCTDDTLYPLFPNEGNLGVAVNGFNPPNMVSGQESKFRLSYYDNYLYFDYIDTSSVRRTMVYTADLPIPGWFPDIYTPGIVYHYGEEGQGVHAVLCCGADTTTGRLYQLGGASDNTTAIPGHFRFMGMDGDDRRADKLYRDFIVDADANAATINVALGLNNYTTTATLTPTNFTNVARNQHIFDISSGNGVEAKNAALDVTWSSASATPKFYLWEPSFMARPEDTVLGLAEWDDLGIKQDKFWQGVYLEADTGGVNRTISVYKDDGTVAATLTVNHPFRCEKPYSFPVPYTSYMSKLLPTDSNDWKLYNYRYVAEPEPPLTFYWISQQTSLGHDGFFHLREAWLTLTNTDTVTFVITRLDDGATFTYTVGPGTRKKHYFPLGPIKAKGIQFSLTSPAGFRVYENDIAVKVKGWGSQGSFRVINPFGDQHGNGAAPI